MLAHHLAPIAGPSRPLLYRAIHASARRLKPDSSSSPNPNSNFSSSSSTTASAGSIKLPLARRNAPSTQSRLPLIPPRSSRPSASSLVSKKAGPTSTSSNTTSDWPWRPVSTSNRPTSSVDRDRVTDRVEYERIIFSRPLSFRPRMLYFVPAIWTVFLLAVISVMSLPPPPKPARPIPKNEEEAAILAREEEHVEEAEHTIFVIARSVFPFFLGLVTTGVYMIPFFPTRLITRLSLVRSTPKPGVEGSERKFLRLSHGGHQMVRGKWSLPRELAVEDVRINLIGTGQVRSPYLNLFVLIPHGPLSFDSQAYKMDFKDTLNVKTPNPTDEVVLSLSRIERVFGKLRPRYAPVVKDD